LRRPELRRAVLAWAARLDRPLPWRGERDPYRVLVSEVMLQQTQALRVVPHYQRFLARFPTVHALAAADAADVLRAWENLGYNRRALNLWRTARTIAELGAFPRTVEELQALPGIGPYTARAVASFAFDADVAAADVNVRRVVARLHGVAVSASEVQAMADALVPHGKVAVWNQAMIDLGAEVCRARDPRCGECPVRRTCAWSKGVRPGPVARAKTPRFEDTTRYARGKVVQALRVTDGLTVAQLATRTGLERGRLVEAIATLDADGLVAWRGRRVLLGPGQRARPRRRSTSLTM
jgi:A/G-specific adenine glycosylase